MRLRDIPLAIGVVIVVGIVLVMLAGAIIAVEVTVLAGVTMLLIERFTPRRLDRHVVVPALVGVVVTSLADLDLLRSPRAGAQGWTFAGVLGILVLTGVALSGLLALIVRDARRLRTTLLLAGAALETAAVLALGLFQHVQFPLAAAMVLAAAGVAAYDDRPVKPTVVPDIAPPSFWRHL